VSDEHIRKIKKEMNDQQKKVKVSSKSPMRNLTFRNSDFTPVKGRATFSTKTNESIQRAILNQKREELQRTARLASIEKKLTPSPGVMTQEGVKVRVKSIDQPLYKKL